MLVGLDRVYVRYPQGSLSALDPKTGQRLDLGALPAAPRLGSLAALDAWRAIAIADLRGALMTVDAGNTWHPVPLPIDPIDVVVLEDGLAIGGKDRRGAAQWWETRFDGPPELLAAPPGRVESPSFRGPEGWARVFGPRPLAAAIEDGWPLVDGSALVARDGALARVRLSDGALVETVQGAFPLARARCHPLSLASASDRRAFGFVCGEPSGETRIYAWRASESRLVELRAFRRPRQVLGFGNGTLAVRGACAADAEDSPVASDEQDQDWCIMSAARAWRGMRVHGAHVDAARLVVLADGRVAILRPPTGGDLSTARLTLVDGAHESDTPLRLPLVRADSSHALRAGIWMDGFEERRAGVLGGWVDAAGSVVGIEVTLDGQVRIGEYIRDAGDPVVHGLWGFGWTASRGGFETTDGGMTWAKEIALPEPISQPAAGRERACGPIGCAIAGWLRIGWGARAEEPVHAPSLPGPVLRWNARADLSLRCESMHAPVRSAAVDPANGFADSGTASGGTRLAPAPSSSWGTLSTFPPFGGVAGPLIPSADVGVALDASIGFERTLRAPASARIYAWGPSSGEWDAGRWQVRWDSPWQSMATVTTEPRSSASAPVPWSTLDSARRGLGIGAVVPAAWAIAFGDDADHALLVAKRAQGTPTSDAWCLESGHAPVEVRRAGGEPLPEIQAALRVEGHWVLATPQPGAENGSAVLWVLDGAMAREVARIPRAGGNVATRLHLARRSEGRGVALAVEGQPDATRPPSMWLMEVDLSTGTAGDPTPLAVFDIYDRSFAACTGDDSGWEIERPYPRTVELELRGWSAKLRGATARVRLTGEHACLESVAGAVEPDATPAPAAAHDAVVASGLGSGTAFALGSSMGSAPGRAPERPIDVSVSLPQRRLALRCRPMP